MRAADLTVAAMLIAGGLLALGDALRLGIGWGTDGPKSGFFPFWLAAIMIAACAGIIAQAWRRADREPFISRAAIAPVLKVLGPAVGSSSSCSSWACTGIGHLHGLTCGGSADTRGRRCARDMRSGDHVLGFERWFLVRCQDLSSPGWCN